MTKKKPTPYDIAYKDLFTHPKIIADLLKGFINQEQLPNDLDFSTLKPLPNEYISAKYQKRFSDIVWSVNYKGEPFYFIIHLELQSRISPFMALRIATYETLLLETLVKQQPLLRRSKTLPPIMSIVVYTGEKQWNAHTNLRQFYQHNMPQKLLQMQPEASFILIDVKNSDVKYELVTEGNLFASVIALEQSLAEGNLQTIADILETHLRHSSFDSIRRSFLVFISRILDQDQEKPGVDLSNFSEIKNMQEQRTNYWINKGLNEGLSQGLSEGLSQGLSQGMHQGIASIIIDQLTDKFGSLSEAHLEQINAMTDDELRQAGRRLLHVNSIDEILKEHP